MNIKGQGHSFTFVQGHSDSTFSNFFSLETARRIEAKFHAELNGLGERKFVQMFQVTRPIWPPCPYMVDLKIILWNQNADDLESWYAASGTRVLLRLFI